MRTAFEEAISTRRTVRLKTVRTLAILSEDLDIACARSTGP